MLRRKLPGLLPVEKAYVDGNGQYWYNISGRQSLDTYCRVQEIGMEFIERLIVSICSEMEILEWNLIHTGCLMLDPELIFITNSSREFIFTIYPCGSHCVEDEFQQMMEYLLTRVDHRDTSAVRAAYGIYEKTLQTGYSILDIRDEIMRAKQEAAAPVETAREETPWRERETKPARAGKESKVSETAEKEPEQPTAWQRFLELLVAWGILDEVPRKKRTEKTEKQEKREKKEKKEKRTKKEKQEKESEVVYPEEEIILPPPPVIRPTVCLTSYPGKPRGILLYQGRDQLQDILLERRMTRIGNGSEADAVIDRDTISKLHARIDREESTFYIEDLNSTNGTFVNEEPLAYKERRKLQQNDIVSFADIRYRFN
jgi:hypothetical protein